MTLTPPTNAEPLGWSIDACATADGVGLVLLIPALSGDQFGLWLDRAQALDLARLILAAAGDARERTFKPIKLL